VIFRIHDQTGHSLALKAFTGRSEQMKRDVKRQFSIKSKEGNIYHLMDTKDDRSWYGVLAVEEHRAPCGTLMSVVNHKEKTFDQRRSELRTLLGTEGVDIRSCVPAPTLPKRNIFGDPISFVTDDNITVAKLIGSERDILAEEDNLDQTK